MNSNEQAAFALQLLQKHWGHKSFRPLQLEIILSALQCDTLALLPTGGGKSVCFQIPALLRDGVCVVVTPLIALMKDQVFQLQQRNIKAVALHSGMKSFEIDYTLDNCIHGNIRFLYVSPERLQTELFRARFQKMKVNLIAVDEAHCISQWGFDFRPSYLQIAELRKLNPAANVLALTASATPRVVEDICQQLQFQKTKVFRQSFARENLSYVVRTTENKVLQIVDILKKVAGTSLIYCRSRQRTKKLAEQLLKQNIQADFYHAGLTPVERDMKQTAWIQNKTRVMCCTNAFGMGIDKADVRTVIHVDVTESPEAYYQESGRAGRDGQRSYAVYLLSGDEVKQLQHREEKDFPSLEKMKEVMQQLFQLCQVALGEQLEHTFPLPISKLADVCQLSKEQTLKALHFLQQSGWISFQESGNDESRLFALATPAAFDAFCVQHPYLANFIKGMLRFNPGLFDGSVFMQEHKLAAALKMSVAEMRNQLKELQPYRLFDFTEGSLESTVFFLQPRPANDMVSLDKKVWADRKEQYVSRLFGMRHYLSNKLHCRMRVLLQYFGETAKHDCGHCDICLLKKANGMDEITFKDAMQIFKHRLQNGSAPLEELLASSTLKQEKLLGVFKWLKANEQIMVDENGIARWNVN